MLDLSGKVAIVTGAGSGIGRGIALALARAGADVVAADLFLERAEETAEMARNAGQTALARRVDVREPESVEALAAACVRELGRLNVCVANAGIARTGSILTMPLEAWNEMLAVNQTGVFLTVQACAREMVRLKNGGRVITIASVAAERSSPRLFAYASMKAAVRMMTRCWTQDLAPYGITVNCIGPGLIETPMGALAAGSLAGLDAASAAIPLGRTGLPEDVGSLACWLASDEASYVTGTYNVIDGGYLERSWSGNDAISGGYQLARERFRDLSGDDLLAEIDRRDAQLGDGVNAMRAELGLP